ncbi:MAG: hypothetical protein LBQ52_06990 [Helicobacteraceae bacterium]|jgi:hypothetical protein|nr:hypothetical protein [Helicobacteraceae bacterium]
MDDKAREKYAKNRQEKSGKVSVWGVIAAILAVGFVAETTGFFEEGVMGAFIAIALYLVGFFYMRIKAKIEKKRLEEDAKKAEEQRRLYDERRRERDLRLLDELKRKDKSDKEKPSGKTPLSSEIKGAEYAKIVAGAFERLNYDIAYRDVNMSDSDAVHLIATRANELCLIHCSKNLGEISVAEIRLFIGDCQEFFERGDYWQDDVKYIYVLQGTIGDDALALIDEERKNGVPIEHRVIGF